MDLKKKKRPHICFAYKKLTSDRKTLKIEIEGKKNGIPCKQKEKESLGRDFPGGPMVKNLHVHCRGHRFEPWSGN